MIKINWLDRSLLTAPYYCLALNEKQYHQALKHLHVPKNEWHPFLKNFHVNATAHNFQKGNGKLATIVCLGSTDGIELAAIYGLLIHEAVHIWQGYHEFIGEENPSKEFEAYSIQRISQNLIDEYMRLTKKTSNKKPRNLRGKRG